MGLRHFSHEHDLEFFEDKYSRCNACSEWIQGPAYHCEPCVYSLHKSCVELPMELVSSLHLPDHPLALLAEYPTGRTFFICDACKEMRFGFVFHCRKCLLNLEVRCALGDGNQGQSSETKTSVYHFAHDHVLLYFNCSMKDVFDCSACELPLSGPSYGCLDCIFFLHSSCLQMPREIQHPYHPHPLLAQARISTTCEACAKPIMNIPYRCSQCDFSLHNMCAKSSTGVLSALQHECHEHVLYCFVPHDSIGSDCQCSLCGDLCNGPFYLCLECNFNAHLHCMPLQPKVKHDCHWHPLTLVDSFVEDDSGEYYCHVCASKRNPEHPVYYCEECPDLCPFVAHIECLQPELTDVNPNYGSSSNNVGDNKELVKPMEQKGGEQEGDTEIQNEITSHDHVLTFYDKRGFEPVECYRCKRQFKKREHIYTCEFCNIYFHSWCFSFPEEIRYPLHSEHPLTTSSFDFGATHFICDACNNVSGVIDCYECVQCHFRIDRKCAFSSSDRLQKSKGKDGRVMVQHFGHNHELALGTSDLRIHEYPCRACRMPVRGSTYCCVDCNFFLHESCFEMPQEIQHPYHLPHTLSALEITRKHEPCKACQLVIWGIGYSCQDCNFFLHSSCATVLTSTLEHQCHEHNLFPLAASDLQAKRVDVVHGRNQSPQNKFQCKTCSHDCGDSFYRCVECEFNIHLECIPLPQKVKHESHVDPLTLMDLVCEDDSGEHYCNVCDMRRNPNHPVYHCEECMFIAHVGCIIFEGDDSLEVITSSPNIIGETSRKLDFREVHESDSEEHSVCDSDQYVEVCDSEQCTDTEDPEKEDDVSATNSATFELHVGTEDLKGTGV